MERKNWTQELRRQNLKAVSELMAEHGGYSQIVMGGHMPDFEAFVSLQIGCSLKIAKDYIETLRGAAVFYQTSKGTTGSTDNTP